MSIIEYNGGPITHRYLMNKSKRDLARMYMELIGIRARDVKQFDDELTRLRAEVEALRNSRNFYSRRCDALQSIQRKMRDPERQAVCEILANGLTSMQTDAAMAAEDGGFE